MKIPRKQVIALVVIGALFVSLVGGGCYFFIKDPFQKRDATILVMAKMVKWFAPKKVAEFCLRQGAEYISRNEKEKAVLIYEAGISADPTNAGLLNNAAFLYGEQGNWEQAAELFKRAATSDPGCFECANNVGAALYVLGRINETKPYFEAATKLNPDYLDAKINLAVWAEDHSDWRSALSLYDQIVPVIQDPTLKEAMLSRMEWMKEVVAPATPAATRDVAGEKRK